MIVVDAIPLAGLIGAPISAHPEFDESEAYEYTDDDVTGDDGSITSGNFSIGTCSS
jgi:hypothetical protein